jgi:hypothetical protein
LWRELVAAGHGIAALDVGGGLGVRYREGEHSLAAEDYVAEIRAALSGFQGRLFLEPGRYLVAEAGLLLTRALLTKRGAQREFLVLDAAMNDLARPALYDAWHDIERIDGNAGREPVAYDVVGPVCETGDTFALARTLPRCDAGDLLAIRTTGAYGMSMASTFNSGRWRPRCWWMASAMRWSGDGRHTRNWSRASSRRTNGGRHETSRYVDRDSAGRGTGRYRRTRGAEAAISANHRHARRHPRCLHARAPLRRGRDSTLLVDLGRWSGRPGCGCSS